MVLHFLRDKRREKLRALPIPQHWEEIVDANVPHSRLLDDGEFDELLRHAQVLMAEKRFEGCKGLEVTEEIKLTIAAWGAILLLGRDTDYYPKLHTILVYPEEFVVPVKRSLDDGAGGAELEEDEARIGESLGEGGPGTIVLAWAEVMKAAGEWADGVNVAIHEFAHQLDSEDGELNGTPLLGDPALRERWLSVFQSEFERLERAVETYEIALDRADEAEREGIADSSDLPAPIEPLLDPYALSNPAEFFAVAMETFFEWPQELEREHPALYGLLREWTTQDPAARWRLHDAQG